MNAKNIKEILISYLKATNHEMRIYQEKSIGSSICDLMTVTDELTGYEIKSDGDNYQRLDAQVKAYDKFFDRNYIVVGYRHIASAIDKVPAHWGTIFVKQDSIEIYRPAKSNKSVSRRAQLSVLWKLELKNILMKNDMPLYAQKEKGYISDRIAETVDDKMLGLQIAYELLHRDYSVYDAKDYSIYLQGMTAELPARELVDMLSENDLADFTLDKWIEIYKQAREVREQKEMLFVEKPKEPRTPHEIPYTDIEVSLGAPWISVNIINEFITHILGYTITSNFCKYEPITGNWYIEDKRSYNYYNRNTNATVKYGTERYNALYIIEASLNLREIRLCDSNRKYDEAETIAALEKQKKIEQEFKDWIWLDEDRRWEVEEAYNKMFGGYKAQRYDGSKLKFEDMSEQFKLYPYQKDAVQKILDSKNTLLAFDVGAGKTFIMIAAAMKMRRDGISRRNMFVVPNHIVGQWEKIFTDLYPKAKVLAIEPKSFKPEMRQKVLRQIEEGDYDGIIIAYSCFEMIPLSDNTVLDNMNAQLKAIENAIYELRTSKSYDRWSQNTLEKEKKRIVQLTNDFLNSMTYTAKGDVTFGDLEISTLFLDEAHNYKNLPIKTVMRNLNGINTKGSNKCLDMLHKIRCVQNSENGRGAVFATGTPLCNSISDAYSMQMYLQYEELEKSNLDQSDNWVKTFAKPEQLVEIDVDTSKYRMVRKFARFHNLPELSRMFSQIAIFYAVNDQDALPEFEGYTDVVIDKYKELTDYMASLCERTEEIRSGKIDRKYDNMLKVSTDGRKAALDLTLVGAKQPYNESSKIYRCIQNVLDVYHRHEGCTQLIFCDYSTPKGEDFSVYKELKAQLMEKGISDKQIAFIHSYNTESRKVELFRKFNAGEVRILIGSTFKLGIGANVQVKLKAIHHLDVPWRPADMVQREGRIIRRGNENESVQIYRYISEGSFDSYSWQILETKQKFISQFLSGSSYQRSITDLEDNVLTYAEVKALALSEPLMKQLAETENEVKALRIVVAKEKAGIKDMKSEIEKLEEQYKALSRRSSASLITENKISKFGEEEKKALYITLSERLTLESIINRELPENLTTFCFRVMLPEMQNEKKTYILLCDEGEKYMVEMGNSAKGNARRVLNFITSFDKTREKINKSIVETMRRQQTLKHAIDFPDETNQIKLREREAELNRLKALLQNNLVKEE